MEMQVYRYFLLPQANGQIRQIRIVLQLVNLSQF